MTFTDLTAAIWDRREITLTDHTGEEITCVPTVIGCGNFSVKPTLWIVGYEQDEGLTRGTTRIRFDSFDGHSQEPNP